MEQLLGFVKSMSVDQFAKLIDHTLLNPSATLSTLRKYVDDTKKFGFRSLVLPLSLISEAKSIEPALRYCTVVGFPLGNVNTGVKVYEVLEAVENGVVEVDVVMNVNFFKSGDYDRVYRELVEINNVARKNGVEVVKVIIETSLLTDDEKITASELVVKAGCDFVKTNTGFLGGGATVHDVVLIKRAVKGRARVKASGGIRRALDAVSLIIAGADVVGTSSGDVIAKEFIDLKNKLLAAGNE